MSSDLAKKYHSITIGDKNTWDDWHLISPSRPLVNPPTVKTVFVDLPGGDGSLDLTEVLAGRPTFQMRSGSWEFLVMNDYFEWQVLYSEIMAYLQGKELRAVLDDDPLYYYIGRFYVSAWRSEKNWSRIVINYILDPYKREVEDHREYWLWDTFNFETGIIQNYKNLIVQNSLTIIYVNDFMEVVPTFITSSSNLKLIFEGTTYNLSKGSNKFSTVIFSSGENTVTFTGTGRVTIETEGGRL